MFVQSEKEWIDTHKDEELKKTTPTGINIIAITIQGNKATEMGDGIYVTEANKVSLLNKEDGVLTLSDSLIIKDEFYLAKLNNAYLIVAGRNENLDSIPFRIDSRTVDEKGKEIENIVIATFANLNYNDEQKDPEIFEGKGNDDRGFVLVCDANGSNIITGKRSVARVYVRVTEQTKYYANLQSALTASINSSNKVEQQTIYLLEESYTFEEGLNSLSFNNKITVASGVYYAVDDRVGPSESKDKRTIIYNTANGNDPKHALFYVKGGKIGGGGG